MRRASYRLLVLPLLGALGACLAPIDPLDPNALGELDQPIVNGSTDQVHKSVGVLHSGGSHACSATLIGARTLLTAAHCVAEDKPPFAVFSPVNFYPEGFHGPKYAAASVTLHPQYGGSNVADIALVALSDPVEGVAPARLAATPSQLGEPVELVGFGKTGEDSGAFGTRLHAWNNIGHLEDQLFRVYGGDSGLGNLCNGDSGGPSFSVQAGQEVLVGVHSTKGGACGQEGNDMRVDAFLGWIVATAQESVGGLDPSTLAASPDPAAQGNVAGAGAQYSAGQAALPNYAASPDGSQDDLTLTDGEAGGCSLGGSGSRRQHGLTLVLALLLALPLLRQRRRHPRRR